MSSHLGENRDGGDGDGGDGGDGEREGSRRGRGGSVGG